MQIYIFRLLGLWSDIFLTLKTEIFRKSSRDILYHPFHYKEMCDLK